MAAKKNDSTYRKVKAARSQMDSETEYNRKAKAHVAAMKREQSRRLTAEKKRRSRLTAERNRLLSGSKRRRRGSS